MSETLREVVTRVADEIEAGSHGYHGCSERPLLGPPHPCLTCGQVRDLRAALLAATAPTPDEPTWRCPHHPDYTWGDGRTCAWGARCAIAPAPTPDEVGQEEGLARPCPVCEKTPGGDPSDLCPDHRWEFAKWRTARTGARA